MYVAKNMKIFSSDVFLLVTVHILFFVAIRQEIKEVEDGKWDSKLNPLKVN